MDEKYLWPLIGVFLGWLLTFAATRYKDHEARQGRVGRLLSKFIRIHGELRVIRSVTEDYKNHADDWEDYERYRKGISDRHFLEPAEKSEGLQKAIDEVSSDYPLQSIQFQAILDTLIRIKRTSLRESAKSNDVYVQVASLHEVGVDICEEQLGKQIRRLAWMHGLYTYLRVLRMQYKSRQLASRNQSATSRLFGETFAEIKKQERGRKDGQTPQPEVKEKPPGNASQASSN
jgi:hypothetical protein